MDEGKPQPRVGESGPRSSAAALEVLRAGEEQFRIVVQNIIDYAIYMLDAGGYVVGWWEGAQRINEYTAEEALGKHLSIFYTPEAIAAGEVDRELEEATRLGRAERESWRVRKSGERFWANEIATAIRDANGNLTGFTKITRDLSERKRADDALRESEERFRLLVENVRDHAVFTLGTAAEVTTWNTGAQRIFGYEPDEIIGQSGNILFTPEDRGHGEHEQELATAAREGRASDDRWQVRKDGTRFWAAGVTSAMHDDRGNLRGFTKVLRDETRSKLLGEQRERLLQQEQAALREAQQAMVLKDEFLAVVSHELRTPLGAILLWGKLLQGTDGSDAELQEGLDNIVRSAEAQKQLIEDLLDVSRMVTGQLRLNARETELASIVEAAAEAVRVTAEVTGVALVVSVDPHAGRVLADPDRIQQVVWNLVNNAVKFTDTGGRVEVRLRAIKRAVQITVTDTGTGISPEFLPHVFERFRQADTSTTRVHGGLGLGLAISRQLVELHGGTIRAESAGQGKGATFTVELPLASARARTAAPPHSRAETVSKLPGPDGTLRGLRILLVEDEPGTRAAIELLLRHEGAEVTGVNSVDAAATEFELALGRQSFDLLLSDIGMPGRSGYDLISHVRHLEHERQRPLTPAIALTAYARAEDRERALAAGFQDHVPKPVEPEVLVNALANAVRRN